MKETHKKSARPWIKEQKKIGSKIVGLLKYKNIVTAQLFQVTTISKILGLDLVCQDAVFPINNNNQKLALSLLRSPGKMFLFSKLWCSTAGGRQKKTDSWTHNSSGTIQTRLKSLPNSVFHVLLTPPRPYTGRPLSLCSCCSQKCLPRSPGGPCMPGVPGKPGRPPGPGSPLAPALPGGPGGPGGPGWLRLEW